MRQTIAQQIEYHNEKARDHIKLAKKYVRDRNFREAARWYESASFHIAVGDALRLTHRDTKLRLLK